MIAPQRSRTMISLPCLFYILTHGAMVTPVVDAAAEFVGEIETDGCALGIPPARAPLSICGDGSLLAVALETTGGLDASTRTRRCSMA